MEPLDYMYKRNKFYKKINSKLYKILDEPNPYKNYKKGHIQKVINDVFSSDDLLRFKTGKKDKEPSLIT